MRVGIIGTNWGRMHVGGFRGAGAEVAALCGSDLEKTRRTAREEGIPFATDRTGDLIGAVDAVVVAGPDALHAEHVIQVLRAGRPVLCEKPLTRTFEDAQRVVQVANELHGTGAVSFPYRQLGPFRALKGWLEGRALRRLLVTVRNGFPPEPQHDPGPLLGRSGDFGGLSHVLDAALWWAKSPVDWLQASLMGRPTHTALLQAGFASGASLSVSHVACPEPGLHGAWSLVGDDWEVGFSAGYIPARGGWCLSPLRAFEGGSWRDLAPGEEPVRGRLEPWAQAHVDTARHFLALASGAPRQRLASLEEGAAVQRLIAAILESEQLGARVKPHG